MKVLIMGATGLLGHALLRQWSQDPAWEINGTYHTLKVPGLIPLNLLEKGAAEKVMRRLRPEVVVYPASNPHVDYCESHPAQTRRLNVAATLEAAGCARELGARFVFFSSDYVFDGKKGQYTEEDEPSPINEYGRQKLEVERALSTMGSPHLVFRISGLFGWELRGKNYVMRLLSALRSGKRVAAALDQEYCPTHADSLSGDIKNLITRGSEGVFHLVGSKAFSRLLWAQEIAAAFKLDASLIEGKSAASLLSPEAARRPRFSTLRNEKVAKILDRSPVSGEQGLRDMKAGAKEWETYASSLQGVPFSP